MQIKTLKVKLQAIPHIFMEIVKTVQNSVDKIRFMIYIKTVMITIIDFNKNLFKREDFNYGKICM